MKSSNKNLIKAEFERFDMFKTTLKTNLGESEFEKCWSEGEAMTIEEAVAYVMSIEY